MDFHPHVLFLFANAFLTTALSVAIVGVILVREYRPTIRRLKQGAHPDSAPQSGQPSPQQTRSPSPQPETSRG